MKRLYPRDPPPFKLRRTRNPCGLHKQRGRRGEEQYPAAIHMAFKAVPFQVKCSRYDRRAYPGVTTALPEGRKSCRRSSALSSSLRCALRGPLRFWGARRGRMGARQSLPNEGGREVAAIRKTSDRQREAVLDAHGTGGRSQRMGMVPQQGGGKMPFTAS